MNVAERKNKETHIKKKQFILKTIITGQLTTCVYIAEL